MFSESLNDANEFKEPKRLNLCVNQGGNDHFLSRLIVAFINLNFSIDPLEIGDLPSLTFHYWL